VSDGRLLPHLTQRRWQRLDDLLEQALAQLPEQRRAFVESACADDPNLRTALERLIEADARNSGFLEPGLARLPEEPDLAGLELGPWRLVTRIGQGGMGSVYRAVRVDGQFEQHVAVKMMRRGLADPGARARFAHEQRVLASLQHPGIARLLDAGRTPDGRPYLVMEHVDGRPIDVYCRERALPVEGRLRLFLGVADAVEHAHGSLLVHRDIKPGNVLVTADGRTKLLDFGIAKQLETGPVDLTPTAHPLMTPGYASPEQVRGELVTTVSDVYSLGVLLYELLCGQPPFGGLGESPFELARAVLEREPPKPSARAAAPELRRRLRGDIDAIVMKALRKEPAQRYASVALLTQDVAAHLAGQPVAARRGGWSYRTGKLLRRHRWVAAGLLLALALGAGLVSRLVSQGRQLAQERDKAQAALAILLETFTRSDPYAASDEPKVRDLLDRGAARALDELEHRPRVAGPLLGAIGRAYLDLFNA
jgi:serine/threonine-protein kinase